ncbi:MAG: tetratricopeptide repeat protein, partial [Acidobacteriota bacterium]
VMPTVADYLGLSAGELVQGVSLIPAIEGSEKAASVYAYLETLYPMTHMGWSELRGIRTDDWKLIVAPEPELYDLRKDPGELKNVIKDFPAEAERLEKEVWRVAGPREDLGKLEYKTLDEESMAKLNALGYVSAGIRRDLQLDMSGPDPKHRVKVLDVFERAGEAMNAERFGEAAVKFEAALQDDPTNPILYQHLGLCQTRLGQYRQALTTYEKAIVHAAETDETFADMGEIYLRLGDLSRAVVAMEKSADRNPANLQNLTNLATAYIQLAEIGEAERVLRAILTQEERHAVAYNLLGILEIQKGNDQAAKRYFEKAVELDEYLAQPHMNLGILAQESGQPGQALAYFRAFVERATSAEDRQVVQQVKAVIAELERTQ